MLMAPVHGRPERPAGGRCCYLVPAGSSARRIAWGLGILLAPGVDPASVGAIGADSIVTAPPSTGTWLVILAQPALAAALYTWLVAWNGQPDLGRGAVSHRHGGLAADPVEAPVPPTPATSAAVEGVSP